VVINLLSFPIVTLDPKMVVAFGRQGAVPVIGFKTTLGKSNACRNPDPHHFPHGQFRKGIYVLLAA
jgi:hypothetical protein